MVSSTVRSRSFLRLPGAGAACDELGSTRGAACDCGADAGAAVAPGAVANRLKCACVRQGPAGARSNEAFFPDCRRRTSSISTRWRSSREISSSSSPLSLSSCTAGAPAEGLSLPAGSGNRNDRQANRCVSAVAAAGTGCSSFSLLPAARGLLDSSSGSGSGSEADDSLVASLAARCFCGCMIPRCHGSSGNVPSARASLVRLVLGAQSRRSALRQVR